MPPPLLQITPSSFPASLPLPTLHPSCHCKVCVSCLTELPPSPYPTSPLPLCVPNLPSLPPSSLPRSLSLLLSLSCSVPPCSPVTPREVTSAEMCLAGSRCTAACLSPHCHPNEGASERHPNTHFNSITLSQSSCFSPVQH